ncbi:MAG TPA: UDP-N-acetylglucosamine 2-epimerase (non-hydrolyzing) [Longimicrobiales bacterium]|nr:UDP-N-acetylglucosamine 2-epimerase (non-hydrolyzing) [Longimicrobiales bacterium]
MKVMVVAGARPNFMKIAPVVAELEKQRHETVLVHTGQHYDTSMSQAFFDDLGIRAPDHFLGVGGGSHAVQTARIMERFEPVLIEARPDWVVVPGDVNSTLGAALVTVKLKPELGTRLAHLEAGLRSHDWRMPEEINRVLTDRCSDLLLTPSRDAHANLAAEGIEESRVRFVGNVMIDTLLLRVEAARERNHAAALGLERDGYVAATLHRPSNVDEPDALRTCLQALAQIAECMPVVLPMHPRTRQRAEAFGLGDLLAPLTATGPLGYLEMLSVTDGARVVLTDSGGLQEETTVLGVPCVTLREQTERPITIEQGTNRLAPWPLTVDGLIRAFEEALARPRRPVGDNCPEGWDGKAAERLVDALESFRSAPATV